MLQFEMSLKVAFAIYLLGNTLLSIYLDNNKLIPTIIAIVTFLITIM